MFCKYTVESDLFVVTVYKEYIKNTYQQRSEKRRSQLLLSFVQPYVEASSSTVSRWIKEALKLADIDQSIFKCRSTRTAFSSKASKTSLSLANILGVLGQIAVHGRDFFIISNLSMRMMYIRKPFLVI